MLADARHGEEFAEGPADAEVFFDAESLQAHDLVHLLEGKAAAFGGKLEK